MVWSYAISDLALSTDAATSVQTSVPTSVQYAPVGTLYDDTTNRSISFDAYMAQSKTSTYQSKISTCTSFITTTNTSISTSIQVLRLNWLRPVLHQSRRHNLATPALHSPSHREDRPPLMKVVHMALISTLIGKTIKTTTTIRRSMA